MQHFEGNLQLHHFINSIIIRSLDSVVMKTHHNCERKEAHENMSHYSWGPTDIQLPDTQLSDTQLPDIQLPGHSGPRTFSSPDTQVFWTSRSFGHSGPRTFSSPDTQVFWTSSSFGHPGLLDIQVFRHRKCSKYTYVGIGYIMPTLVVQKSENHPKI